MDQLDAPTATTVSNEQPDEVTTHLHGRRLILARGTWLILVVFTIGLYVVSVPVLYHELLQVCMPLHCNPMQLSPADVPTLRQLHLTFSFYAAYNLSFYISFTLVFALIAVVIFWRRSDDRIGLFVSFTLIMYGAIFPPVIEALAVAQPLWRLPAFFIQDLALFCIMILAFLFPDGHFVPRWLVWVAMLFALWCLVRPFLIPSTPFSTEVSTLPLRRFENILGVSLYSMGALAQLYRYTRGSSHVQRQQSKWAMFGLTIMLLGLALYVFLHFVFWPLTQPGLGHVLDNLISLPSLLVIPGFLFPITIGIAILRYRLWDIDVLINRTLVYGLLTGVLALIYFGLVIALQFLVGIFLSHPNAIVIVVSTLTTRALFQPLRYSLQTIIDRRFYRRKYDAAKTLEAFSATLRHEVDLSLLGEQLVAAVQETMQPSHVSLWLRPTAPDRKQQTVWSSPPASLHEWEQVAGMQLTKAEQIEASRYT
jgi:MFS family permease